MKANVGDWLVIKNSTNEHCDQRGIITEVHSGDGAPPYMVRWLETGRQALVFPGPDGVVVTAAKQRAADEQARSRLMELRVELGSSR